MSLPQPLPESTPPSRRSTALLVDALKAKSAALDRVHLTDRRVAAAEAAGAGEFLYVWQTGDGHEAEMRVYYRRDEEIEVLAGRLERVDGRVPAARHRARYEDAFDAEMQAAGDLWMEVVSHLWEKPGI